MKKCFLSKRLRNQFKLFAVLVLMNMFNIGCSVNGTSQVVTVSDSIFIVNINAKNSTPEKPVSLQLNAGTYNVTVIGVSDGGAYDAWKAWFKKGKKDDKGDMKFGWINKYSYSSNEFPEVTFSDSIIYETPALALQHAINSKFSLKTKTAVNFYINDSPRIDNAGGISLRISKTPL